MPRAIQKRVDSGDAAVERMEAIIEQGGNPIIVCTHTRERLTALIDAMHLQSWVADVRNERGASDDPIFTKPHTIELILTRPEEVTTNRKAIAEALQGIIDKSGTVTIRKSLNAGTETRPRLEAVG